MYWSVDQNVVTRDFQEPIPVIPPGAMVQYLLSQYMWHLYKSTKLLQVNENLRTLTNT